VRILLTADWHIGVTHHGVVDEDGRNSRLVDLEATLSQMVDIALERRVDLFVCAGDIFHTNRPTPEDQRIFWRLLSRLQREKIQSRFIIGNHDYNSKLGASHALKLFMDVLPEDSCVRIYDETSWEHFDDKGLIVCYFPYRGVEPEWRRRVSGGDEKVAVVCHSHLEGAVVGAEPFEIKDDNVTRFSSLPVDYILAGHFHKPQTLSTQPLAIYPGSPQCVDFNERKDEKRVVILDTDTGEYESEPLSIRKFVQIDLDSTCSIDDVDLSDVDGAVVKINIAVDADQAKSFDEAGLRDRLASAGAQNVTAINLNVDRGSNIRDVHIKLDNSLTDNFKRFMSSKEYGDISDDVLKRGLEIIESCRQPS